MTVGATDRAGRRPRLGPAPGAPAARRRPDARAPAAGLLVVVDDGEGHAGIGETAPLPGLHVESARGGRRAAARTGRGARRRDRSPTGCPALDGAFEAWLGGRGLHPSVRTGIEGAVLTLLADRAGMDLPHLLAASPAARVRINGLLDGDAGGGRSTAPRVLRGQRVHRAQNQGRAARRGRRGANSSLAVRALVGPAVALRLDANRAWDLAAAQDFARARRARRHRVSRGAAARRGRPRGIRRAVARSPSRSTRRCSGFPRRRRRRCGVSPR